MPWSNEGNIKESGAIKLAEAITDADYNATRYDLLPMLKRSVKNAIHYAMSWGRSEAEANRWATCPKMLVDIGNDGDYEVCGTIALHRKKGWDNQYYTVNLLFNHDLIERFIEERNLNKGEWADSWFDAWELSDQDYIDLLTMKLMFDDDYLHPVDFEDEGSYYPDWLY